jgi:hypothetical protein
MSESIFYTQVDGKVQGLINSRGGVYGASTRDSKMLSWLTARQVFASATADAGGSLGVPTGGGFGKDGSYSSQTDKTGDSRLIPKPHITSIKITDIGDWGSVKRCDLSFTCYSIGQLDSLLGFCKIGKDITVNYGWAGVSAYGGSGNFKGTVFNFNYTVNTNGGWDCTTSAMAKGIDAVSGNAKGGEKGGTVTDPLGNEVPIFDIVSRLNAAVAECKDLTKNTTQDAQGFKIGCLEYASSWGAAAESSEAQTTAADATAKEDEKHYYVTLGSLVTQINDRLIKNPKAVLKCDSTITKSVAPTNPKFLISANPKEVIFSGYNTYGPNHDFNFDVKMGTGPLDSSSIFISTEWIATLIPELADKEAASKSADMSISAFLGKIFDSINANSGQRIALSITQNPDKKDGSEWWVVDIYYAPKEGTIFTIQAFNNNSVVRSISIDSRVPSEMAAAAAIAPNAATGYAGGSKYKEIVLGSKNPAVDLTTELEALKKLFDATKPATEPKAGEDAGIGPTETNVSSMQSLLSTLFNLSPDGTGLSMLYPLGFSATFDGVEGFKFGNTVTTNYLPSAYKGKVVFTITKVSHDISMSDWTTTIETVCRLPA